MTRFKMSEKFIISGAQLGMLLRLCNYDSFASEIVDDVLMHKVGEEE